MIEPWMGEIVSELHMKHITQTEVAKEIKVSTQFLSMALSGKKKSATIEQRIRDAISRIEEKRRAEEQNAAT